MSPRLCKHRLAALHGFLHWTGPEKRCATEGRRSPRELALLAGRLSMAERALGGLLDLGHAQALPLDAGEHVPRPRQSELVADLLEDGNRVVDGACQLVQSSLGLGEAPQCNDLHTSARLDRHVAKAFRSRLRLGKHAS